MMPSTFSTSEFSAFIDSGNYPGHLLVIHMFLLDYLLGRFCVAPEHEPKLPGRKFVIISWVRSLARNLPDRYQRYIEWALQYCDILASQDSRYLLSP